MAAESFRTGGIYAAQIWLINIKNMNQSFGGIGTDAMQNAQHTTFKQKLDKRFWAFTSYGQGNLNLPLEELGLQADDFTYPYIQDTINDE